MRAKLVAAALGAILCASQAEAAIKVQTVEYKQGATPLEGWLVYDDAASGPRPGVIVYPEWWGPSAFEKMQAERLAKMGYVAFVADIYGKGVRPNAAPAAAAEMKKYLDNRPLLLARAKAGFAELRSSKLVNPAKLAAIGFCFGGAPALDMGRNGAPLVDIVTFHGFLSTPDPQNGKNIRGHVLALHGAADPAVPAADVAAFEKEMTDGHVDWEVDLYGGVLHAFTDNIHPSNPAHGSKYDPVAARRAWASMSELFKATL
jgi:dienelactone hydrolase